MSRFTKTALRLSLLVSAGLFFCAGCASTSSGTEDNPYAKRIPAAQVRLLERAKRYQAPTALTVSAQVPASETFNLEIPKIFFDQELPGRYQNEGMGIINSTEQFTKLWNLYSLDNTALMPSIDFKTKVLFFVYDAKHYNQVKIVGMDVNQGVASARVWHTNTELPIQKKVQVAFLQMPRNFEQRPGITAIFANGDIISVPEQP